MEEMKICANPRRDSGGKNRICKGRRRHTQGSEGGGRVPNEETFLTSGTGLEAIIRIRKKGGRCSSFAGHSQERMGQRNDRGVASL